jgi:hypothetical protein
LNYLLLCDLGIRNILFAIFTVKPRIDRTNLQKVTIKVGLQVNLDVNVAGEPPPTITWTLNDNVSVLYYFFHGWGRFIRSKFF